MCGAWSLSSCSFPQIHKDVPSVCLSGSHLPHPKPELRALAAELPDPRAWLLLPELSLLPLPGLQPTLPDLCVASDPEGHAPPQISLLWSLCPVPPLPQTSGPQNSFLICMLYRWPSLPPGLTTLHLDPPERQDFLSLVA